MCGGSCKCVAGTCVRAASTPPAHAGKPLGPATGAESCRAVADHRYGIFAFDGTKGETSTYRITDLPRYELLPQVARALDLFPTVLVERVDNLDRRRPD